MCDTGCCFRPNLCSHAFAAPLSTWDVTHFGAVASAIKFNIKLSECM